MTYEQYWYGDVCMVRAYREADRRRIERKNMEYHLMGMYVYEAICDVSPVLHAFARRGAKPIPYRTAPYSLKDQPERAEDKARQDENDRLKARLYMSQMMAVGKSWGKK